MMKSTPNKRDKAMWDATNKADHPAPDKCLGDFIKRGGDINMIKIIGDDTQITILGWVAFHGRQAWATALIRAGADIHFKNNNGESPIVHAVRRGHAQMVALLLDSGADPFGVNKKNQNMLHVVARSSRAGANAIVLTLLKQGLPVDAVDKDGETAVMCAAKNVDILRHLIDAGANLNLRSLSGDTVVHKVLHTVGVATDAAQAFGLLIARSDVDFEIEGACGCTAAELAKQSDSTAVAAMMRSFEARQKANAVLRELSWPATHAHR